MVVCLNTENKIQFLVFVVLATVSMLLSKYEIWAHSKVPTMKHDVEMFLQPRSYTLCKKKFIILYIIRRAI